MVAEKNKLVLLYPLLFKKEKKKKIYCLFILLNETFILQ